MAEVIREEQEPRREGQTILPADPEVQECKRILIDGSSAPQKIRLVEGTTVRRLGRQETGWHALFQGADGASLLQYSLVMDSKQELTPNMVQLALEALQRQVPMLRTRVEDRDDGSYLVVGPYPSVKLEVLKPGGDWLKHHHKLLNETKIDPSVGPLWKACFMLRPTNIDEPPAPFHRSVLYLSLCHTITDGLSNAMLCGRVLENLDFLIRESKIPKREPAPYFPSVEDMLQRYMPDSRLSLFTMAAGKFLSSLFDRSMPPLLKKYVRPHQSTLPKSAYSTGTIAVTVPNSEVARLRTLCHAHSVSLNAALSAAVSFASAQLAATAGASDVPTHLPTLWLVNARRYMPDADWMYLSTVAGVELTVNVEHADLSEFWSVAEALGKELRTKLNSQEPLFRLRSSSWFSPSDRGGLGGAELSGCIYSINNLGPLDRLMPRTRDVRAAELHRAVRAPPALTDSLCSHCFQTVGGRLCYDLNYVRGRVADEDAERFSRLVVEILAEVASPIADDADHDWDHLGGAARA
ncbi:hypothetical protein FJT64_023214 [Amphibalanus amphitrite]|uniref:Condensation domain-containing protein n=1 Tax=Amphibalanus amphitrite TaxID=1232801 RepID=A0A6A4WN38_AMPAM|nr:hypothetical protein FJT64_023214 [Amphibalanus amphitrite]